MVPAWTRGEERAELLAGGEVLRPQRLAVTALGNSPGTAGRKGSPPRWSRCAAGGGGGPRREGARQAGLLQPLDGGRPGLRRHRLGSGPAGPAAASRAGRGRRAGPLAGHRHAARPAHRHDLLAGRARAHVPAAAVSVEDAELLHRLLARGPVRVRLTLGCGFASPATVESANVVAEVRGRERPEEVVVIGAHLDSWDLGTGAIDDGAGVVMVMEALRQLSLQPVAPRRTVRAVLFMNEENGLEGGLGYARRHAAELARTVAAVEADSGAGRPLGFTVTAGEGGLALLRRLASPLAPLGAARVEKGGGGSDISPLGEAGVPVLSLDQETSRYFDWHHSAADTFDKVVPAELAASTAAMTVMAWQLAESDEALPRVPRAAPAKR